MENKPIKDCADCGEPIQGEPIYWMGTSARCAACHAKRGEPETMEPKLPGATATYSPEDNKLRLYPLARLDAEMYARVKVAGFSWAPRQKLFVAPMWTPARADLLVQLCGEIGDEDTSLVDRAEERADRFGEYHENRKADAHAAKEAVERIADGIPFGQPILVGHHSERRARRDAERVNSGMRKAVKMWETAQYWTQRAKGALRHARYKELPAVRYRRIKSLEADKRRYECTIAEAERFTRFWSSGVLDRERAMDIANHDHMRVVYLDDTLWSSLDKQKITPEEAASYAIAAHAGSIAYAQRWIAHIDNRIAYERAMLGEDGGTAADKFPIEVGGRVLGGSWYARLGWLVVLKVNRDAGGMISSVKTIEGAISIERIAEYKKPNPGDAEKVKKATKLPPLVNYPGEGFRHMTKAEYDRVARHSDMYRVNRIKAGERFGAHRRREAPKEGRPYYDTTGVYLTDVKRVDPPLPEKVTPVDQLVFTHEPAVRPDVIVTTGRVSHVLDAVAPARAEGADFDAMRDSLKAGVTVVSAPQLFPTPQPLAADMVERAGVEEQHRVLEPSAGTGVIVRELRKTGAYVVAVEISAQLAAAFMPRVQVEGSPGMVKTIVNDFLSLTAVELGTFDCIVMNPPFVDGADAKHVMHAWGLLRDGGILVSVMSAAVKWRMTPSHMTIRALVKEHGELEDLPEGTFADQGTNVQTVLVTLRKGARS